MTHQHESPAAAGAQEPNPSDVEVGACFLGKSLITQNLLSGPSNVLQFTRFCDTFVADPLSNGVIDSIDTFAFSPARRSVVSDVAVSCAGAFLAGKSMSHLISRPGMQLVSSGCLPPLLALLTDPRLPDHTQERVASLTLEAVGVRSGVVSLPVHMLAISCVLCAVLMRSPHLAAADRTILLHVSRTVLPGLPACRWPCCSTMGCRCWPRPCSAAPLARECAQRALWGSCVLRSPWCGRNCQPSLGPPCSCSLGAWQASRLGGPWHPCCVSRHEPHTALGQMLNVTQQ